MLFTEFCDIRKHLTEIRTTFGALADSLPTVECDLKTEHGLGLLTKYREIVANRAGSDWPMVEAFWAEHRKERLCSLGDPIPIQRSGKWSGIYRSELLDRLSMNHVPSQNAPYPLDFLNRLTPSTRRDQEFAFGIFSELAEWRRLETSSLMRVIDPPADLGRDAREKIFSIYAQRNGLIADKRTSSSRRGFLHPIATGLFELGLIEVEGNEGSAISVRFELLILPRRSKYRLRTSGELEYAPIMLSDIFPGYDATYRYFQNFQELCLNVWANIQIFLSLARFLEPRLSAIEGS